MTQVIYVYNDKAQEIYALAANPLAAWTVPEWFAELDRLRAERDALQVELAAIGEPLKEWPEDAKQLWWEKNEPVLADLRFRLDDVVRRLSEMEGVVKSG